MHISTTLSEETASPTIFLRVRNYEPTLKIIKLHFKKIYIIFKKTKYYYLTDNGIISLNYGNKMVFYGYGCSKNHVCRIHSPMNSWLHTGGQAWRKTSALRLP